ncbi:MAG: TRAP transporter large permease [Oscillospiraceae bacterium]|nr:TRAP transporter large permease [Oscillospiraceae bacterium]
MVLFFVVVIVLLVLGTPIAAAMALSSVAYVASENMPVLIIIQRMFEGVDNISLLCVPFFVLAGDIMAKGGIAKRLVNLCNLLVGNITGGLAIVTILACTFFAAITGSAIACCYTIGVILIPYMVENGYKKDFATGVVTGASVLGPIIPPSINLILFATIANASVVGLYRAGIPTGIILAGAYIILAYITCKRNGYRGVSRAELAGQKITVKFIFKTLLDSIWALGAPVIILGAMFTGICTPTESAVIAVLYSLIISIYVYKTMKWKDLYKIMIGSAIGTAKIIFVIAAAGLFSWIITFEQLPQKALDIVLTSAASEFTVMAIMCITWLLLGCVLNGVSIFLITLPIFIPIAQTFGYDLVHFGILACLATGIGQLTPPFGICLFAGMDVGKESMGSVTKQSMPYIVVMLLVLILIWVFPKLVMFIV